MSPKPAGERSRRVRIYHNPRCSKSRQTLALLEERGIAPEIVLYLETPPSEARIEELLDLLGVPARALMRKREAAYRELGLGDPALTRTDLVAAMAAHPILIERPVVVSGTRAAIGRPPENVLEIL